jgi:hypothetical protein
MSAAPIRLALAGGAVALMLAALASPAQAVPCTQPGVLITAPTPPTVLDDRTSVRGTIDVAATIDSADPLISASAAITPLGGSPSAVTGFDQATTARTFDTTTLPDGGATLSVTADNGCPPATVQTADLYIDNTAPTITITQGPAEGEEIASVSTLAFAFSGSAEYQGLPLPDPLWPRYRCRYDAAPFGSCAVAPPSSLGPGSHAFTIEATDRAGNVGVLVRNFRVASPPPPGPAPAPGTTPPAPATTVDPTPEQPADKPACRVPRLRGLTLTAARTKLTKANCRLGRVTKPPKRILRLRINRGQRLVVQRQSERAGVKKPNGQKVGVALVPRRDLKLR